MISADVVVDLQYGDCGKGKVSHHLARANNYTHVLRYNGGCNAGHTIFHKGKKFVTEVPLIESPGEKVTGTVDKTKRHKSFRGLRQ